VEVIKKLDKGEELVNLAEDYGVGPATIRNIRKYR
jgi:hypothetical protein